MDAQCILVDFREIRHDNVLGENGVSLLEFVEDTSHPMQVAAKIINTFVHMTTINYLFL